MNVAAAAHVNHIGFFALMAERCGGAIDRHDGTISAIQSHPFPFLNGMLVESEVSDPAGALEHARDFFAEHDRSAWSVFARPTGEDDALEDAMTAMGMEIVNPGYREMIRTEPIEPPPLDANVELREVKTDDDRAAYWRLCSEAYASLNFPPEVFHGWEPLIRPPTVGCLAWLDGRAVGAALVIQIEGVALIAWVAAASEARGKGVGGAVTAWTTNRGLADGGEFVSLQASPMGLSVYERLGFETIFAYRVWRYAG